MAGAAQIRVIDAVGAAVLLGLTGLGYLGTVQPLLAQSAREAVQRRDLEQQRVSASQSHQVVERMETALEETRRRVQERQPRLEAPSGVNRRVRRIGELAATSGLEIYETQVSREHDFVDYTVVPIRLGGRGGFPEMLVFLRRMHREFPDVYVSSFDLSGQADLGAATESVIEVKLAWYAAADPEE